MNKKLKKEGLDYTKKIIGEESFLDRSILQITIDDNERSDCERIQKIFKDKGFLITLEQSKEMWETESDKVACGWCIMDSLSDENIFDSLKHYFNITWETKYLVKLQKISNKTYENKNRYSLMKLTDTEYGYTNYIMEKPSMNRSDFEKDRTERKMDYLQFAGSISVRHCTSKDDGERYAYFEEHFAVDNTKRDEKNIIFEDFLTEFKLINNISNDDAFYELLNIAINSSGSFHIDVSEKITDVIDFFIDNKNLLILLNK
jgi:hypothetical protein